MPRGFKISLTFVNLWMPLKAGLSSILGVGRFPLPDRSDGAALMHSSSNKMFGLTHCQWLLRALWFKWANLKPLDSKSDANKIEGNVFKSGFDFICSSKSRETVALIGSNKPTSQDADSRLLRVCIRFEFQIGHSIVNK